MRARGRRQPGRASEWHIDRSDPSTRRLLRDISKCAVAADGENERLAALAREGDDEARRRLIEINLRLVLRIASELSSKCGSSRFDDMVMEGTLGLNDAIDGYRPNRNVKFCNYAGWWVRKRMLRLFWDDRLLHYPEAVRGKFRRIEDVTRRFVQENSRMPGDAELHELTGIDMETIILHAQFASMSMNLFFNLNEVEIDPVSGLAYNIMANHGDEGHNPIGLKGNAFSVFRDFLPLISDSDFTDNIEI